MSITATGGQLRMAINQRVVHSTVLYPGLLREMPPDTSTSQYLMMHYQLLGFSSMPSLSRQAVDS